MRPRRYPSDTTDEEWALIEPLLPTPACQTRTGGRPEKHHRRDVFDAIRYITGNAAKWRPCHRISRPTRRSSASSAAGPGPGSSTGSVISFAAPSGCALGAAPTRSPASSILSRCALQPL
ncbi:transposase [Nonomuraea zeae]|uniref:transposase n=1 Tax=Nonomuraea zeae TaxID=1642303 RepID=UPI0036227158